MEHKTVFRLGLFIITLFFCYVSYLVLKPFLLTMLLALIFSYVFYPLFNLLAKKCKGKTLASILTIIIILLLIIIPSTLLVSKLATESASAYRSIIGYDFTASPIFELLPENILATQEGFLSDVLSGVKDYIVLSAPNILGELANLFLHLFIFFFIMFFALIEGAKWYCIVRDMTPLKPSVKKEFFKDLERAVHAIMYGQVLTAVVQGAAGGLMFFVFGVPNAVFWGFVMIILSFIPLLGTPIVWLPAALIELAQGNYVSGIAMLIIGFVVIMNVDNFVRPYFVNKFAPIHPLVVILGVLGGLQLFGFAGFILGPLILALFVALLDEIIVHRRIA